MNGILREIDAALQQRGLSDRAASLLAGHNPSFVRDLRSGSSPSIKNLRSLCEVLGLELYIGPSKPIEATDTGLPTDEPSLLQAMRNEMAALRADVREIGATVADPESLGLRAVQLLEIEAAAGGGAAALDDSPIVGPVYFRRDWISQNGIDPGQTVLISVHGDSMEPTLPSGSRILVDRRRRQPRPGAIYVITTSDGLVVKRMRRDGDGAWLLVSDSDSPDWPDVRCPPDAEVVGEARWMARELP